MLRYFNSLSASIFFPFFLMSLNKKKKWGGYTGFTVYRKGKLNLAKKKGGEDK